MKSPITLRGVVRRLRYSKRLLINRRGDGVHSPFAYHFITRVVRNRRPYYCFEELRAKVKHVRQNPSTLELLFRTAHELEAKRILILTAPSAVSLLPDYLYQTGYTESLQVFSVDQLQVAQLQACDFLVCEYLPEADILESLIRQCLELAPTFVAALYMPSPRWRHFVANIEKQTTPRLTLDLMDICLHFYDKRLTPSRYKGVY